MFFVSSQRTKEFEDWGLGGRGGARKFRTAGVTDLGGGFAGGSVPHYMPCLDNAIKVQWFCFFKLAAHTAFKQNNVFDCFE